METMSCKQIEISFFSNQRFETDAMILQKDIDSLHFPYQMDNQNIDFLVLRILESSNPDDYISKLAYLATYSDALHSTLLIEPTFIDHLFTLALDISSIKVFLQIILIYIKILKKIQILGRKYFHFGFYSLIIQIIPEFSDTKIILDIFFPLLRRLLKCYPFLKDRIYNDINIPLLLRNCFSYTSSELMSYFSLLKTLIFFSPAQYVKNIYDLLTDILDLWDFNTNGIPNKLFECLNELIKRSNGLDLMYLPVTCLSVVFKVCEREIDILDHFEIISELLLKSVINGCILLPDAYNHEEYQKVLDIYCFFLKRITNEDYTMFPISFKIIYQLIPICSTDFFHNLNNFISNSMKKTFQQKKMRAKLICLIFLNYKHFILPTVDEILEVLQSYHYFSNIIYTLHEMTYIEEYRQLIEKSDAREILLQINDNCNESDANLVRKIIDSLT